MKTRQDENACEITWEETELDQALEEIIDKEKMAEEKGSEAKKNKKRQLQRNIVKVLWNFWGRLKKGKQKAKPSAPWEKQSRGSSCDVVGYPTEKHERESYQRKKELELRKIEQQANVQKQQHGKMKLFMQQ